MSEERFKVVIVEDGNLVTAGYEGRGLSQDEAEQDALRRNKKAEALGVEGRYEAKELGK